MSLRLRKDLTGGPGAAPTTAAPAPTSVESAPSISGWLGVLATMLPRRQAESVREELETHLRERVRDLMVGGLNEAESTRRAIAELGEAAELAGKYRALAHEPRRRIVMYGSIFAVAGAALALSVAAVSGGRQPEAELAKAKAETEAVRNFLVEALVRPQPEAHQPTLVAELIARAGQRANQADPPLLALSQLLVDRRSTFAAQPPAELDFKADVKFVDSPASDVLEMVEKFAKMPLQANWPQLNEVNLDRGTKVTLQAKGAGPEVVLRALNEAAGHVRDTKIEWRAANGVIEVGSREHFDRREVKLVIYNLDGIIAARQAKYDEERSKIVEEIVKLVCEFVSPEGWQENGGDLAKMTVVGDRMFVEAPERFHKQIRWMLDQLPGDKPRQEGNAGGAEDVQRYVIQYIDAQESLKTLKANQAIKAIDFSEFTADAHTNCVIGKASPEQHAMVRAVLGQIDTEAAALKERKRAETAQKQDERKVLLQKLAADRAEIERRLKLPDADEACLESLRKDLKSLNEQEALLRTEVEKVSPNGQAQLERVHLQADGAPIGDSDRIYLTGPVACPGVYVLSEGLTLRRLLAAAGGLPPNAKEVVISESKGGQVTKGLSINAETLRLPSGSDPDLKGGQLVSVR